MRNQFLVAGVVALSSVSSSTMAFERDHAAHEHGHAKLMVVQDKGELQIRFESPAMNIVGFEHQPKSKQDHEKIDAAAASLKNAAALIMLNTEAGCKLEHVSVESALLEEDGHHDEHHGDHKDHDHHKDHDDHHGHKDEQHEEVHSEFAAEYHFDCANTKQLTEIKLGLFKAFASLEEVNVQLAMPGLQKSVEANHDNATISLR